MEVDINTCINHTFRLATLAVSFSVQLYRICTLSIGLWALEESHFIRIHLVLSAECRTWNWIIISTKPLTLNSVSISMHLGVGIDDMFVILQCWNNLAESGQYSGLSVEKRVGMALQENTKWHFYYDINNKLMLNHLIIMSQLSVANA